MGAWGADTFQNDMASDWNYGLDSESDLAYVRQTLESVRSIGSEYLDSDFSCAALAACEVIARLKGNWGLRDAHSKSLDEWVQKNPQTPPNDLIQLALEVIDRVTTPPSELQELWLESDEGDAWLASVRSLRGRVAG